MQPAVPALAIEISEVSFTYPGSEQPVLSQAALTIEQGEFTAVIGGNGSGKSTLCKLFNGLIPYYYSGDFEGEVKINGQSTAGKSVAELSRMVGYVYQDFDNQLVRPTVLDEACFAPLNYGLADYRERAFRALDMCGLTHLQDRYIWELSGGQKHLLALAGALSLEPDILIVDEPVSQLDPRHARQVYEVLRQINQSHGKTVIVIEHHTEFIADYCRDVCLMEQGRVRWKRPVTEALNSLEDLQRLGIQPPEVTQTAVSLRAALEARPMPEVRLSLKEWPVPEEQPSLEERAVPEEQAMPEVRPSLKERTVLEARPAAALSEPSPGNTHPLPYRASEAPDLQQPLYPITTEEATQYFGTLLPDGGVSSRSSWNSGYRRTEAETAALNNKTQDQNAVIRFHNTSLNYRTIRKKEQSVLHGIGLTIYEGERIALVGNNGAGKSSLMKLIAGIAKPSAGSVAVLGQDTNTVSIERLSRHVAYVFQNPEDMFIEDSIRKEIAYCLKRRGYPDADQTVARMLHSFRLEELQERDARLLSGGQQRRVSLAIGAAVQPAIMLLDEPTANLDMATREELLSTLKELDRHVRTVIIATHDMQLVNQWATRVIVMNQGAVWADDTAARVFADPDLIGRAGLALTQSMELSNALGLQPASSSPAELAARLHYVITGKENIPNGACSQLV
ncbi:ABC transporter [Paenibacillus stellifer]|uniref:ABC transporter n=1 Tax=Paenibacillus stellifer TaxID=169760 RepID=A0A089LRZ5_9BACL|nr:ABC transporter [Paenibacillus stellifer]